MVLVILRHHEGAVQTVSSCGSRELSAVIGLRSCSSYQNIGARMQALGYGKLQLACLIAAKCKARTVVSLDVDTRPA